jgi:hypothetical protein
VKLLRVTLASSVLLAVLLASATTALAASYTLFGDATLVHPGNASNTAVQLRSVGTSFGGIDFTVPSGMTVGQLNHLSTDYKFTTGTCGGGGPRFQVNVGGRNIFVYIGPPPSYTNCAMGTWVASGNVLYPFVDTSQLPGGTFYDTWVRAQAAYGSMTITGIQLVTDGGWAVGGTQTVLVDNVTINSTTYTFEADNKEACKNGGWQDFTFSPGPFSNQGDCVSHFASGG